MKRLGAFIQKNSIWVLASAVVFILASVLYGTTLFTHLENGGFEDKGSESYQVVQEIKKNFSTGSPELIAVFSSKQSGQKATDPAFQQAVEVALDKIAGDKNIQNITTYYVMHAPGLLSTDQTKTFAAIDLKGDQEEQEKAFPGLRDKLKSDQLNIQVGGQAAFGSAITTIVENDLKKAETISFTLLGILLVIVFRSLVAALLPLLLGGFAILGAFLVTRLLTNIMDISQFAINVIIFLGLGLAIDYSLFIVSRFREELRLTGDPHKSLQTTMATAGRTVMFSGITVMISLLSLMVFPLGFLRSMGIGGASAVLVAMLGALIVLPALLTRLGPRVNALSFGSAKRDHLALKSGKKVTKEQRSFWYKVSHFVMARPLVVIVVILVPLVAAGLPFRHAELQSPDYRSLPKSNDVRLVSESLAKDFPAPPDPIQIIIKVRGEFNNMAKVQFIDYAQKLQQTPGINRITSISSTDDKIVLASAYYQGSAYDKTNRELVKKVREVTPPDSLDVKIGGPTAQLVDQLQALRHFIPYALVFIILALVILLFLMLDSVVIPIKAVILNILSLSASFGALVWIFQYGHLENLLGFESVGAIDSNQPVLIFAIAFGLSMDYAVFLLSRIKEQYNHHKDTAEAVAEGVQKTGGIITSAALLLIVVVGAFGTSQLPLMKQLAVGLVLAIAIDAVIIRMLLVPATMKLLGRYNWWAPKTLRKLHRKLGLAE